MRSYGASKEKINWSPSGSVALFTKVLVSLMQRKGVGMPNHTGLLFTTSGGGMNA